MQRIIYLLLLAGYLMVACRTGKNGEQAPDRHLLFGNGGGVTGEVITYTLHADGGLTRTSSRTKESEKIGSVSREKAAGLFEEAQKKLAATPQFNHPGNRFYFVKLQDGKAAQNATWGDNNHAAPAGLENLYDQLIALIRQ